MNPVRAFRGATQLTSDTKAEMREAVVELLKEIMLANEISNEELISILFTATPDLQSDFPAAGVRELGLADVPLICAQELDVKGSLPRTIRLMIHANSGLLRSEVTHKYLRGASILRPDLAQGSANSDKKLESGQGK
ncbi:MAG: chorismate mutase [Actinomycetes bacterium]